MKAWCSPRRIREKEKEKRFICETVRVYHIVHVKRDKKRQKGLWDRRVRYDPKKREKRERKTIYLWDSESMPHTPQSAGIPSKHCCNKIVIQGYILCNSITLPSENILFIPLLIQVFYFFYFLLFLHKKLDCNVNP